MTPCGFLAAHAYPRCLPLPHQVRLLLTRNWLGCRDKHYHLPGGVALPCVGGDWILVAARMFPFVIVALFDTALFYQVGFC